MKDKKIKWGRFYCPSCKKEYNKPIIENHHCISCFGYRLKLIEEIEKGKKDESKNKVCKI